MSGPLDRVPFLDLPTLHEMLGSELEESWKRVLACGTFVGGPEVELLETAFAAYCETGYCVGVANGTDALELVLAAAGIGRGDEVILPANTFVATAEAVCAVGARPRFVDVLPGTLLIDPAAVEAAVTAATAAVIAVHLFGQTADVDRLRAITDRHSLVLIEDAAQAHGARFGGHRAGSLGHAAGFSFYPGKNLGAFGDGGAVVTDDRALAAKVRSLANHGRSARHRHHHEIRGRNSRLDALQAAVLGVKLTRLDRDNALRRAAMDRYRARLPSSMRPVAVHADAEPVYHLAVVQVDDRDDLTESLTRAGIGWGVHYPVPCHRQPAFAEFATDRLPVAEHAADRILSLPMSPTISTEQLDRVCAVLEEA